MVELIKNQEIDIAVLARERSEFIQEAPGENLSLGFHQILNLLLLRIRPVELRILVLAKGSAGGIPAK